MNQSQQTLPRQRKLVSFSFVFYGKNTCNISGFDTVVSTQFCLILMLILLLMLITIGTTINYMIYNNWVSLFNYFNHYNSYKPLQQHGLTIDLNLRCSL